MQTHLLFPSDSVHHASFFPQKDQFNEAMKEIPKEGNVLLAPHLCPAPIPKDWILYNAEQIGAGIGSDPRYIELLKRHEVWDYSKLNIVELNKLGIKAKHCPLGYSSCLERIKPNEVEQDIDVLFYGSINQRREKLLLQLHEKCKLQVAFGIYGAPLDALIARAKIIANIHFYPTAIHEITRTSYLMANKKFVVSEMGRDVKLEKFYSAGIAFCEYDDIVLTVLNYLEKPNWREETAMIGYNMFKTWSQREMIEKALAA